MRIIRTILAAILIAFLFSCTKTESEFIPDNLNTSTEVMIVFKNIDSTLNTYEVKFISETDTIILTGVDSTYLKKGTQSTILKFGKYKVTAHSLPAENKSLYSWTAKEQEINVNNTDFSLRINNKPVYPVVIERISTYTSCR